MRCCSVEVDQSANTDSALIIDAMDLLYAGNVDGFVIVSSDSDFTRLATRLRESGMTVYGLGRRTTPAPFVAACDRFIYLDLLSPTLAEPTPGEPGDREPTAPPADLKRALSTAVSSTSRDDGWSSLSAVGSFLTTSDATFDARNYGHSKLGELVRTQSYLDVRDDPGPAGTSSLWVRLKPPAPKPKRGR